MRMSRLLIGAALIAPMGAGVALAQTNPNCNDAAMVGPNPIYMAGSSAIEPTLAKMALKLKAQGVTIIYKPTASCDGPNSIINDTVLTGNGDYYVPDPMDATKAVIKNCVLDATPTKAAIGIADVSFTACVGTAPPAGVGDFQAMVQSMLFVVPAMGSNPSLTAISAEQAQAIWGCGMKGAIGAFTDENLIQQRNSQSGTQIMISKYINLPADQMKGHMNASTGNMVTSLTTAGGDPTKLIGFVAADAYEAPGRRMLLRALAFKGVGQTKAYYADSEPLMARDKKNVRDGHYMIQGPLHLVTKVGADNLPADANAKKMVDWLQGNADLETGNPKAYIDIVAGVGNVPQCAMQVRRLTDGGFLGPYTPAKPCGCYFEHVVSGKDSDACKTCGSNADCTSSKNHTCNYGYCE